MLSVIIPYRNRHDQLPGCLRTLCHYLADGYEVIIAEQADPGSFLRGQLFNLAVAQAAGSRLLLFDVDGRFLRPMLCSQWLAQASRPVLPFDRLVHLAVSADGQLMRIGVDAGHGPMLGLCNLMTREQFERAGGFSNLFRGWGPEDQELADRLGGYIRLEGEIGHIAHDSAIFQALKDGAAKRHARLRASRSQRDASLDSFRQTQAAGRVVAEISHSPPIRKVTFSGITVSDDFRYRDLL
jgi:hypothetical protein